jgi:sulfite reductase (NADPH) flavoprotein alpha-component
MNTQLEKTLNNPYTRKTPFQAILKGRCLLTSKASSKVTMHLVLEVDSTFSYKVGDSVGVFCKNNQEEIGRIAQLLNIKKEMIEEKTISLVHKNLLRFAMEHGDAKAIEQALQGNADKLLPLLELLQIAKIKQVPLEKIPPLLPRFYSIASCPNTHPNEVHLTVTLSKYQTVLGHTQNGVATDFLLNHLKLNEQVAIYHHPTIHFTVPKEANTPVIMIGPGTGIAPFRAFLQKRLLQKAEKNWLFFGEWHKTHQFYYQKELEELEKRGFLKLDTAFSRDGAEKVYVQHLLEKQEAEFLKWIKEGAIIYICGDAKKMAKGVEASLLKIFEKTFKDAKKYLKELRQNRRLLLDVY